MGVGELMLVQQIRDDMVNQRCRRQSRFGSNVRVQRDGSLVSIIRSRQTAESLAGAAASATAAAAFL
jgi:hypothetical protein